MRVVAAQLFQKLNNLGDFVFTQNGKLEGRGVAVRVEFILMS